MNMINYNQIRNEVDKKFAAHFSPPSFRIDDVGFTKQSLLFNDKQDTK